MPSAGLVIGTMVRSAGSAGQALLADRAAAGARNRPGVGAGPPEVVQRNHRADARVPLGDVGDAGGAVGMADEADLAAVEQLPERVVGGVQPGLHARRSAWRRGWCRCCSWAPARRGGRAGEQEVDRVLGAVVERPAVALGGEALVLVGRLAVGVGLTLALRIEGQHDVARLGQRLRGVPVHLLVGLDRAVGDHDARPLGGPATVAQTCPEIVAPSRAVNSTGRTSP